MTAPLPALLTAEYQALRVARPDASVGTEVGLFFSLGSMSRTTLLQTSSLSAIFLPFSGELAARFGMHAAACAVLYKFSPDGGPEVHFSSGRQGLQEQACLGEDSCKADLTNADVGQTTGFEHGGADQPEGNHVDQKFPVTVSGRAAMQGGDTEADAQESDRQAVGGTKFCRCVGLERRSPMMWLTP